MNYSSSMISYHLILVYITVCQCSFPYSARETPLTLAGRTPCCADRLTSLTCQRLALKHPVRFASQCMNSADFAFVQCCASCFNPRFANSSGLYEDAVRRLIVQSEKGDCLDVRGHEWCTRFARRETDTHGMDRSREVSFWEPWFREGCDAFPFAFRVCRASCGFCSTGQKRATISFNHTIAMDRRACPTTRAFSKPQTNYHKGTTSKGDFDPLASLEVHGQGRKVRGEYIVMIDRNYIDYLEEESDNLPNLQYEENEVDHHQVQPDWLSDPVYHIAID